MPIDRATANISFLLNEQAPNALATPATDDSLRQVYEALLDAAPEHIFLVTTNARMVYANQAAINAICAATSGITGRDDILGRDMRDLNYPEWFLVPFLFNLAQAAGGEHVSAETLFPTPLGDMRNYEYTLSPIRGADGTVHIVVGVTRDIHDRKVANRERQTLLEAERAARQEAETAVRVRDDFLSIAAHDLKTPLTAAQGRAQLLLRQIARDGSLDIEKVQAQATAILSALTQMAVQIGELQDIAFLQIGRPLELNTQSSDLTELVRRGVTRIAREDPNVRVDLDFAQEPINVELDQVRIERVLDNLLSNSFKYTGPDKTIIIKVWEERDQSMQRVFLSVTDNGIGIPPDDLPLIFDRFSRGSNARTISGAGIGLSGAQQIARQHGGDLTVASVENQGSTFTMWLPIPIADKPGTIN